jgi:hypothetical protein
MIAEESMEDLEKYWRAVQSRVCIKCVDGDGQGNCRISNEDLCGLKLHFPRIVETILSVQSSALDPYVDALRHNVCTDCKHQLPDGTCKVRTNIDCGLDRYFPMVIEAIESVRSQRKNSIDAFGD